MAERIFNESISVMYELIDWSMWAVFFREPISITPFTRSRSRPTLRTCVSASYRHEMSKDGISTDIDQHSRVHQVVAITNASPSDLSSTFFVLSFDLRILRCEVLWRWTIITESVSEADLFQWLGIRTITHVSVLYWGVLCFATCHSLRSFSRLGAQSNHLPTYYDFRLNYSYCEFRKIYSEQSDSIISLITDLSIHLRMDLVNRKVVI